VGWHQADGEVASPEEWLKAPDYVDFWVKLFEKVYNIIDSPLKMVDLLV